MSSCKKLNPNETKIKEPGKPMPGVNDIPKLFGSNVPYLLVLAGGAGALVSALLLSPPLWLQPANTPTARPNSAIRVINLFIVA